MSPRAPAPAVAAVAAPAAAAAQVVDGCGRLGRAEYLAEPWEAQTRTFANGAIRLAVLDTFGEPACCSVYLLVLQPAPGGEPATARQCRVVAAGFGRARVSIDCAAAGAGDGPRRGLLVRIPVVAYVDGVNDRPGEVAVRINRATGAVTTE